MSHQREKQDGWGGLFFFLPFPFELHVVRSVVVVNVSEKRKQQRESFVLSLSLIYDENVIREITTRQVKPYRRTTSSYNSSGEVCLSFFRLHQSIDSLHRSLRMQCND